MLVLVVLLVEGVGVKQKQKFGWDSDVLIGFGLYCSTPRARGRSAEEENGAGSAGEDDGRGMGCLLDMGRGWGVVTPHLSSPVLL